MVLVGLSCSARACATTTTTAAAGVLDCTIAVVVFGRRMYHNTCLVTRVGSCAIICVQVIELRCIKLLFEESTACLVSSHCGIGA